MNTVQIVALCILGLLLALLINGEIYLHTKKGWMKFFYHNILGWHKPDENQTRAFDGASWHCRCKYCHKRILQDSQGNWFLNE